MNIPIFTYNPKPKIGNTLKKLINLFSSGTKIYIFPKIPNIPINKYIPYPFLIIFLFHSIPIPIPIYITIPTLLYHYVDGNLVMY
jgi:hypothetical protein